MLSRWKNDKRGREILQNFWNINNNNKTSMTLALFFKPFLDKNLRKKFQFQALRKYRLAPFLQVCCRPAPIKSPFICKWMLNIFCVCTFLKVRLINKLFKWKWLLGKYNYKLIYLKKNHGNWIFLRIMLIELTFALKWTGNNLGSARITIIQDLQYKQKYIIA